MINLTPGADMIQRFFRFISKYLLHTALIAALYVLMARLGFLIALPPGNVTPLWPPSGIALAAGLVLGYYAGIGVWLGSFIVNIGQLDGAAAPLTAAIIATGSTLQMFLGILLLRRFIGLHSLRKGIRQPELIAPTTPLGILFFIGLTALAALAAPTLGVISLCAAGFAPWSNFYTLWWTWWMGDYAGILTIAPTVIVVTLWLRKQATVEPIFFPLASVWLGLSLIVFSFLWHTEEQNLNIRLHTDSDQMIHDIQQVIDQNTQRLVAVQAFYNGSNQVERTEFRAFTASLLQNGPAIQALSWIPRVPQTSLAAYQQTAKQDGLLNFEVFERTASGGSIAVTPRPEYFPVYYIEPFIGNQPALGFDLASNPLRFKAIATARDTGQITATAPITLLQETGQQKGILILIPIYRHDSLINTIEERRANLLGFVSGVFRTGDMVKNALERRTVSDIELYLFDTTSSDAQFVTLYSCQGEITLSADLDTLKPTSLRTDFYNLSNFDVGGRKWLAVAKACPLYIASARGPEPWAILLIGLALSGIMLAYTEIRQRAEIALRESESTTRLVMDNAPDAIVAVNTTGNIVLANAQTELTFGYLREELLGAPFEILLPKRFQAEYFRLRSAYFANPARQKNDENLNLYCWHKDQHEFPVDVTISSIDTSQGRLFMATIRDISEQKRVEQKLIESEQTYRALFEHANDAIFLLDLDRVHQHVNQKAADLLGYTREELVGMSSYDVIAPGEYDDAYKKLETLKQGGVLPPYERLFRKKDGQIFQVEINLSMVRDANGKRKYIQSIVRDVTERKNALEQINKLNATLEHRVTERTAALQKEIAERKRIEAALQLSHDQLRHFVGELEQRNREVTLLSALTEILESCHDVNEAYQAIAHHMPRLFPEDAGLLYIISNSRNLAENVAQWGDLPSNMDATFTSSDCWALRRGREHQMESPLSDMLCKHVTQTIPLPLPCACIPMMAHGETLGILHIRYNLPEGEFIIPPRQQLAMTVAEQLALVLANLNLRETLRNQSIRDALTGLYNRRYMEESMIRELRRAERASRPMTVAMLDLDHFKRFNDTFGHAAGDVALRAVSDMLKTKMRAGDIVCRYGGEEFVIIFVEMTLPNAINRMEGLRNNIRQLEIEYIGKPLGQLTISVGIAAYPEYGSTPETLLKAADDALYRAKQTGRDRVVVIPIPPES